MFGTFRLNYNDLKHPIQRMQGHRFCRWAASLFWFFEDWSWGSGNIFRMFDRDGGSIWCEDEGVIQRRPEGFWSCEAWSGLLAAGEWSRSSPRGGSGWWSRRLASVGGSTNWHGCAGRFWRQIPSRGLYLFFVTSGPQWSSSLCMMVKGSGFARRS